MIPQGLITQIGMMAVAVGIFFTFIQPTLGEVRAHQDEIARMREQREQVTAVNTKLANLLQQAKSIDQQKYQKLTTYLPSTVDSVAVQRDILSIADEANVTLTALSGSDGTSVPTPDENLMSPIGAELKEYSFNVGFSDSYENIKNFLLLLERNHYPLHVTEITLTSDAASEEGGVTNELPVAMKLVTYSLSLSTTTPVSE